MRRFLVLTVTAALLLVGVAGPAGAAPPVKDTLHQVNVVQDQGQACGFPVRWDIDLTAERTRFYDSSGRLVRAHFQISELNTVTNLATGYTVQDGPVRFLQRVLYNEDGTITVEANGLSVKILAETGKLFDVGRFTWHIGPDGVTILQSAGKHAPREAGGGGVGTDVLAAFCDVLTQ